MRITTTLLFSLLLIFSPLAGFAASLSFVDYDGDGFDDNIIDTDNNGIPDEFQAKVKTVRSTGNFTFSPGSFGKTDSKQSTPNLTKSEQFSLYKFKCRALTGTRSDFESDFGAGLNVNTSSGSSCAGGVCF